MWRDVGTNSTTGGPMKQSHREISGQSIFAAPGPQKVFPEVQSVLGSPVKQLKFYVNRCERRQWERSQPLQLDKRGFEN